MEEKSDALNHSDRMFNLSGEKASFFPSVGLKLTGACRFACSFCCEPNRTQYVAPIGDFVEITNILREFGTRRLCFTGGEPLLYPEISRLLKHTKSVGFYNLLLAADGAMLKERWNEVVPFVDAVRLSIHALGAQHDEILCCPGLFKATEEAIDMLTKETVPCFVTTVVTPLSLDHITDIAQWCVAKKVKRYFLFGLIRSGLGQSYITENGEVSEADISRIIGELKRRYSPEQLEIIYYDYASNAECILVYGDGRVVIDPYPHSQSFQLEIGNIFTDAPAQILDRFFADPENYKGYSEHLRMYNKLVP
jgi:MoaA/NifB/PqqE/SkfB family radical SAM enzyme